MHITVCELEQSFNNVTTVIVNMICYFLVSASYLTNEVFSGIWFRTAEISCAVIWGSDNGAVQQNTERSSTSFSCSTV